MDVHVPLAITEGLRLRGVDVLRAQQDGSRRLGDPELLNRAGELGRVLFTRDLDLLAEATRRQREGAGLGECVRDLELVAVAGELEDLANQVLFLPLE